MYVRTLPVHVVIDVSIGKNDNHCIATSHLYHADDEPMTDYCVHKKSPYREAVSIM